MASSRSTSRSDLRDPPRESQDTPMVARTNDSRLKKTWKVLEGKKTIGAVVLIFTGLGIAGIVTGKMQNNMRTVGLGIGLLGVAIMVIGGSLYFQSLKKKIPERNEIEEDAADGTRADDVKEAGEERAEERKWDLHRKVEEKPVEPLSDLLAQYRDLDGNGKEGLLERMIASAKKGGGSEEEIDQVATMIVAKFRIDQSGKRHVMGLFFRVSRDFVMKNADAFLMAGIRPNQLFEVCRTWIETPQTVDHTGEVSRRLVADVVSFLKKIPPENKNEFYRLGLGDESPQVRKLFEDLHDKLGGDAEQYIIAKFQYHVEKVGAASTIKQRNELKKIVERMLKEKADLSLDMMIAAEKGWYDKQTSGERTAFCYALAQMVDMQLKSLKEQGPYLTQLAGLLQIELRINAHLSAGHAKDVENLPAQFFTALWSSPHLLEVLKGGGRLARFKKVSAPVLELRRAMAFFVKEGAPLAAEVNYRVSKNPNRFCKKIREDKRNGHERTLSLSVKSNSRSSSETLPT